MDAVGLIAQSMCSDVAADGTKQMCCVSEQAATDPR